jgi:outer membrane protein
MHVGYTHKNMSKNIAILLIVWNVALSAVLAWSLTRPTTAEAHEAADAPAREARTTMPRDTTAMLDARIAYFFMDTVQEGFTMVKEQSDRFRKEGRRLETNLQNEMTRAQKRYEELMRKDHTYSTKAEIQQDEAELQGLMGRIQQLQSSSEQQLARMEVEMLSEISDEIMVFLDEYNSERGFDFIFSVQNGGQIWVGNPDLDITQEVVDGLNARHKAAKAAAKK